MKQIPVVERILKANDAIASQNRHTFMNLGIVALNFMGAPGTGKTSLLERTLQEIQLDKYPGAIVEGDISCFSSKLRNIKRFLIFCPDNYRTVQNMLINFNLHIFWRFFIGCFSRHLQFSRFIKVLFTFILPSKGAVVYHNSPKPNQTYLFNMTVPLGLSQLCNFGTVPKFKSRVVETEAGPLFAFEFSDEFRLVRFVMF